jgi:hypothetical protein
LPNPSFKVGNQKLTSAYMGAKAPKDYIMEKDTEWKTRIAKQIMTKMRELNIPSKIKTTKVIGKRGKPVIQVEMPNSLPGLPGDDRVTLKDILEVVGTKKPVELWYCRALANKHKLNVPFMDRYFYHEDDEFDSLQK